MKQGTQKQMNNQKNPNTMPKECVETPILIGPRKLHCPQIGDHSTPSAQSTLNNPIPYPYYRAMLPKLVPPTK